jgi:DNA helicase-2/ATP-dependent DNA helicase PcrA
VAVSAAEKESVYARGAKFGYGAVVAVEGNKLTVAFEQAGQKKVIDSFVERG